MHIYIYNIMHVYVINKLWLTMHNLYTVLYYWHAYIALQCHIHPIRQSGKQALYRAYTNVQKQTIIYKIMQNEYHCCNTIQ